MRRFGPLFAALLWSAPLPAVAQEMCAGLNRIAAAAREPSPFASLAGQAQNLLPGLEGYCQYRPYGGDRGGDIFCNRSLAPEHLAREPLVQALRDCLGAVYVPGPTTWAEGEYRAGDLQIRVHAYCDDQCQVGRLVTLIFTRRREADAVQATDSR